MMNTMPTLFLSLTLVLLSNFISGKTLASMDLKSLIIEGLQNNINIKNQRINLEKAKIDLSNSKKAYLPTVSLSSGLSYSHSAGEGTVSKTASLTTSWTLWDHWQTQTTIKNTGLSLKNEEISTFKAVQDYILNVLGSYLSLQLLKNEKVIT
ncbi:MAG: TolC family protein, partial [Bdellovibrionota bacterium]|nr:TolC family protein [Bdellovibrionota bacterium]